MRFAISPRVAILEFGVLAGLLLSAEMLAAQNGAPASSNPGMAIDSTRVWPSLSTLASVCARSTPADLLTRTTAYLDASIDDSRSSALTMQADLMAQQVAESIRTRIGGTPDSVPKADSVMKSWSVPAELIATMRADGSAMRRARSWTGDTLATSLLLDAFDKVRKNGDGAIVWPDGYTADSIVIHLHLETVAPMRDGSIPKARYSQFAAFQILEPIETPALPKPKNHPPTYPYSEGLHHVIGTLLLQFVVDSSGFVVPSTMRDIWPSDKPRLTGELGRYYDDFVEASEAAVVEWRFYPASVGSCHVRQIVQLPIVYGFPKHSE